MRQAPEHSTTFLTLMASEILRRCSSGMFPRTRSVIVARNSGSRQRSRSEADIFFRVSTEMAVFITFSRYSGSSAHFFFKDSLIRFLVSGECERTPPVLFKLARTLFLFASLYSGLFHLALRAKLILARVSSDTVRGSLFRFCRSSSMLAFHSSRVMPMAAALASNFLRAFRAEVAAIFARVSGECLPPLFQGVFPLLATEIFDLLSSDCGCP